MTKRLELAKDIVATASLLIKLGIDGSILEQQSTFIEFLNEAGVRTVTGKEFTKMSFRQMFARMTPSELSEIMSEFSAQRNFELLCDSI